MGNSTEGESLWIDRLGVEIEIGVDGDQPGRHSIPLFSKESDCSLENRSDDYGLNVDLSEYVSDPVDYPSELSDLKMGIRDLYSCVVETNYTMGLHIHASLNKPIYRHRLASKKFHDHFISYLKDSDLWNEPVRDRNDIWRLKRRVLDDRDYPGRSGRSSGYYCQPIQESWVIDRQIGNTGRSEKFRRIRFHPQETVEFRLFPAMDTPEHVFMAIEVVTQAINKFLREGNYQDEFDVETQKPEEIYYEEVTTVDAQDTTSEQSSSLQEEVIYNV